MTTVIFVDDEPNILAALRRSLHELNKEWDMRFVDSGDEALKSLRQSPADVIVSDIRMPTMDGIALLTQVRSEFPNMVRLVLSGYSEFESTIHSLPVAHQFLNKPCDPQALRYAIQRASDLQNCLSNVALRSVIGTIDALPSPSHIIEALNHCLESNEPTADEVANIVTQDVAITAKLLQLANSAFFGLGRHIADVREAIMYLGLNTVRDLTTAAEIFRTISADCSEEIVNNIEDHSIEVGTIASKLLDDERQVRMAYSIGLLHDVGELVLAAYKPHDLARVESLSLEFPERAKTEIETELLGATHAEIGAYLLSLWGLPSNVVECVARHHDAHLMPLPATLDVLHAVHIAEAITATPKYSVNIDELYLKHFGVADRVNQLVEERAYRIG